MKNGKIARRRPSWRVWVIFFGRKVNVWKKKQIGKVIFEIVFCLKTMTKMKPFNWPLAWSFGLKKEKKDRRNWSFLAVWFGL